MVVGNINFKQCAFLVICNSFYNGLKFIHANWQVFLNKIHLKYMVTLKRRNMNNAFSGTRKIWVLHLFNNLLK